MKTLFRLIPVIVVLATAGTALRAQGTASGTLTVTATVQGTISLVFLSNASGVALTGSNSNAATLAFGDVNVDGTLATGVTRSLGTSKFTVSSPVDIQVIRSNSASANYTLKAQLSTADTTN